MKYKLWSKSQGRFVEDDTDLENREEWSVGEYAVKPDGKVCFYEDTDCGMTRTICNDIQIVNND